MRRGFTLLELMFATTISAIVFTSLFVAICGVFKLMKTSSEELQLAIHARVVRERLLVRIDGTHDGLMGVNATVDGTPSASTGFNVHIARSTRGADGSVQTDLFAVPGDVDFLKSTKATDVGLTGNVVDKVRDTEFLPVGKSLGVDAASLIQLNLYHHPAGSTSVVLEDHPVFYMENGAW